MNPTLQTKVDQYIEIYEQLYKTFKWKVTDPLSLMMIASMYVVNQKPFDVNRLMDISDGIKKNVGMLSTLNSPHRYTFAAMLDVKFENPMEQFSKMLNIYEHLIGSKFSRESFTYLCAYILLTIESELDLQTRISRSRSLYKGMRSNHFFLTSSSDYPLAVLLSNEDGTVEELLQNMEHFYSKLNQYGFSKGNDLQFLSHVLSLNPSDRDIVAERCVSLLDECKRRRKVKIRRMHYPVLGLLSFLENGVQELDIITEIVTQLNHHKRFKWHKDINFMMAVNFLVSEKMDDSNLIGTNMYTIIETLIQAQQAVMIAVVAGSAAASSSGGE